MEEITVEKVKEMLNSDKFEFKCCQTKLFFPVLKRMYIKMQHGVTFPDIKVAEGHIVEGHHRYICSLMTNTIIGVIQWTKSWSTQEVKWESVEVDHDLLEDPKIINRYHEDDSKKYGIDIEIFKNS